MARYRHQDVDDPPQLIRVAGSRCPIDSDGYFDAPGEAADKLRSLGHELVSESEAVPLTEEMIVREDDYRTLQAWAGQFDDVPGNLSKGELEEALIQKVRQR